MFVYLGASTELHQLLHLPVFFSHYHEHQTLNHSISLLDFIVIHYFDSKTPDYTGHHQLPFKDKCPEVSLSIALPPDDIAQTEAGTFHLYTNLVLFKSLFRASSFHFSIWQPPRA